MLFKCGSPLAGGLGGRELLLVCSHLCKGVTPRAVEQRGEERGKGEGRDSEGGEVREGEGGRVEGV